MVNKSKNLGTSWESQVVAFLNEYGFRVERRALAGKLDKGDIAGIDNWVIECKNTKALDLAKAQDEARQEAINDKVSFYVGVHKRRRKPTSRAYAVLDLEVFAQILMENQKLKEKLPRET